MLAIIRVKYPAYHPILAIADLAHSKTAEEDPRLALDCHKTLLKHISPELRSVEGTIDVRDARRVVVSMFEEGDVMDVKYVASTPQVTAERSDPLWDQLDGFAKLALLEAA